MGSASIQSIQTDVQKLQSQVAALSATVKNVTAPVNPSAQDKINQANISSSQIMDVLWNTVYYYITDFPDIYVPANPGNSPATGYANWTSAFVFTTNTPTITLFGGALHLTTHSPSVAGDSAQAYKVVSSVGGYSFAKASRFRTQLFFDTAATQTIYTTIGSIASDSYGFKISGSTLLGFVSVGGVATTTVLNTTIDTVNLWKLDARFLPGQSVTFFVNNVQKGAIAIPTALPKSASSTFWNLQIAATSTTQVGFGSYYAEYIQLR